MENPLNPGLQAKIGLLANIPNELQILNQWVCWRYEDIGAAKPTKVPYHPNGFRASHSDVKTWSAFKDCVGAYASGKFDGVGFVFSLNDPYTFIDLDDTKGDAIALERQFKIFKEFDSYSEKSPSGTGLHIIIKGNVPVGRKRSSIEIYSQLRYATFTGDVYHNKPIEDRQTLLTQLWEQMGTAPKGSTSFSGDDKEAFSDDEIIRQASTAANGDKFNKLNTGEWQGFYKSQSEADFAFIDIIAFYTQNRNQIARIFRNSQLGSRDKAQREDYVGWMINRSFDRMLPPIDFDSLKTEVETVANQLGAVAQRLEPVAHNGSVVGSSPTSTTIAASSNGKTAAFDAVNIGSTPVAATRHIKLPPGLLGEIAQFIYQAAPRPVPEIALAGAIGLMAGIAGRAYNVSATGLNQYVLLLAGTGSGKEAIQHGISKLMNVVKQQVPTAPYFIGPSEIASGQALFKYISNSSQCFVTVLGEFGLRMLQLSNQNANGAEVSLRRMLLDLYNKSGFTDVLQGGIYADKDKNINSVQSPAFSICGESTPERFYGNLNEDMISEGLLPRFLLIEYTGPRVAHNEGHEHVQPTFSLIEKLTTLAANAETIQRANPRRVVNVKFSPEARAAAKQYDLHCDRRINNAHKDVIKQLWNRAHVKVLKLAAIVSVGCNMYDPVIEVEHLEWAIDVVSNDIETLSYKFEEGKIGANTTELRQIDEIIRIIKEYILNEWEHVMKYSDKNEKARQLHQNKVVSYSYISRRLTAQTHFKNDKIGATNAIKRCLQIMTDRDYLKEVSRAELNTKFGTTQKAFMVSDPNILK